MLLEDYDREERAAIMEYDGGLPRDDAERLAGISPARTPERLETYQRPTQPPSVRPEPIMAPQSAPASVFCGQCVRFHPGEPWPWESLGRCTVTPTGLPPKGGNGYRVCLPMAPRRCPEFLGPTS
jgi:hypothetical protein